MTYSHNSVRNNIKMTTASATKSIRLKKGASESPPPGPPASASASAPATPLVTTAHSNSIASSTNFTNSNHSSSPTNSMLTPNNRQQQRQQQQQLQLQSQSAGAQRIRQQRQSPQQTMGGGGFYFANNIRRNGGGGGGRSPQSPSMAISVGVGTVVRQSPASILGGGFSPSSVASSNCSSTRKQRRSPTLTPFSGGKISPQQLQQQQQQHPLIPTALTHFAGSKCFDAPAPTALPKPPQHWTSTGSLLSKSEEKLVGSSAGPCLQQSLIMRTGVSTGEKAATKFHLGRSSKRNLLDDFDTHNLKLLLNVQS